VLVTIDPAAAWLSGCGGSWPLLRLEAVTSSSGPVTPNLSNFNRVETARFFTIRVVSQARQGAGALRKTYETFL